MAAIKPTITFVGRGRGVRRIVWTPVTENDTCAPLSLPEAADKSIQALGTFGGASVALHGSNDNGSTYAALNTAGGSAIAMTVAGIKSVLENTEWIKPVVTGGTAQSLTIAVLASEKVAGV